MDSKNHLIATPILEIQEFNAPALEGISLEKSSQRLVYTKKETNLVAELNFKHSKFEESFSNKTQGRYYLYQASFKGYNDSTPMQYRAGRINIGNNRLQTIDGAHWHFPWTERIKTSLSLGQVSSIQLDNAASKPSFSEAEIRYKLNSEAFATLKRVQIFEQSFNSLMLGYRNNKTLITGEYQNQSATDSLNLAMQLFDQSGFDLTSEYNIQENEQVTTHCTRHYLGYESNNLYFEFGIGNNNKDITTQNNSFIEGSISFDTSLKERIMIGSINERTDNVTSKTIYARAERNSSRNTILALGLDNTSFSDTSATIQNLEGSIRQRLRWGYVELRSIFINGITNSKIDKDISLSAGYNL